MNTWKKRSAGLFLVAVLSMIMVSTAFAGQWMKDGKGWWYQRDNGTYPVSEWMQDTNGIWYYFGGDGYMLADTTTPDGFKVDSSGAWVTADGESGLKTDNSIAHLKNSNSEYLIWQVQYIEDAGDSYKVKCDIYEYLQISPSLISGKRAGDVFTVENETYRITDVNGFYGGCNAVRVRDGIAHYFASNVCPNGNWITRYEVQGGGEGWMGSLVNSECYVYISKNADIKWIDGREQSGLLGNKEMSPSEYVSRVWETDSAYFQAEFIQFIRTDENGIIVELTALYDA